MCVCSSLGVSLACALQKEALDKLVMPGYNGSPFVQSVLVTPRAYHTSARLAGDLIRAVFNVSSRLSSFV